MRLDARPEPLDLDPRRVAMLVIDVQNDFASPGGMFDRAGIDVSGIAAAARATRPVLDGRACRRYPCRLSQHGARARSLRRRPARGPAPRQAPPARARRDGRRAGRVSGPDPDPRHLGHGQRCGDRARSPATSSCRSTATAGSSRRSSTMSCAGWASRTCSSRAARRASVWSRRCATRLSRLLLHRARGLHLRAARHARRLAHGDRDVVRVGVEHRLRTRRARTPDRFGLASPDGIIRPGGVAERSNAAALKAARHSLRMPRGFESHSRRSLRRFGVCATCIEHRRRVTFATCEPSGSCSVRSSVGRAGSRLLARDDGQRVARSQARVRATGDADGYFGSDRADLNHAVADTPERLARRIDGRAEGRALGPSYPGSVASSACAARGQNCVPAPAAICSRASASVRAAR